MTSIYVIGLFVEALGAEEGRFARPAVRTAHPAFHRAPWSAFGAGPPWKRKTSANAHKLRRAWSSMIHPGRPAGSQMTIEEVLFGDLRKRVRGELPRVGLLLLQEDAKPMSQGGHLGEDDLDS